MIFQHLVILSFFPQPGHLSIKYVMCSFKLLSIHKPFHSNANSQSDLSTSSPFHYIFTSMCSFNTSSFYNSFLSKDNSEPSSTIHQNFCSQTSHISQSHLYSSRPCPGSSNFARSSFVMQQTMLLCLS